MGSVHNESRADLTPWYDPLVLVVLTQIMKILDKCRIGFRPDLNLISSLN